MLGIDETVRKSHKKAVVAVAHKMIRLIYLLLSRRQPYIDQGIDYAQMSSTARPRPARAGSSRTGGAGRHVAFWRTSLT
jgi:hypothetical protein